jgi:hypothetical protein
MGAVRWSKFGPALALAEAGADVDWRDATSRPWSRWAKASISLTLQAARRVKSWPASATQP